MDVISSVVTESVPSTWGVVGPGVDRSHDCGDWAGRGGTLETLSAVFFTYYREVSEAGFVFLPDYRLGGGVKSLVTFIFFFFFFTDVCIMYLIHNTHTMYVHAAYYVTNLMWTSNDGSLATFLLRVYLLVSYSSICFRSTIAMFLSFRLNPSMLWYQLKLCAVSLIRMFLVVGPDKWP